MDSAPSRRQTLRLCASAIGLSVAGCTSTSNEQTSTTTTENPTPETTVESRPLDSCPAYEQPSPSEWAMFGYDARNTGANPKTTGPKTSVEELWKFETGGLVECSPTVVADTVYVTSRDRNVYAISATDGTEQWRYETGIPAGHETPMRSSPTVVDGTVYVGGGNYKQRFDDGVVEVVSRHNYLYALDAETGELEWRFQPEGITESSPTVVDGIAYFACKAGNVYAVDTADGSQRWRFSVDSDEGEGITATPAVTDCTVYVGGWDKTLYALDARDGSVKWRHEADEAVSAAPAVHDGTVYVGINGGGPMKALSMADGEVEWEYPTKGSVVACSPAVADGTVYIGDYSDTGRRLHAINADSGEEVWTARTRGYVWSSPAVVDGVVYVGGLENMVYGFDGSDGAELWRFETEDIVRSSPAVVDGVVYVGSSDGNVYALHEA